MFPLLYTHGIFTASLEEELEDDEEDEDQTKDDGEGKEIKKVIGDTETDAFLQEKIAKAMEQINAGDAVKDSVKATTLEEIPDEDLDEPADKKTKIDVDNLPSTLHAILKEAGMHNFVAPENDAEHLCLRRVRALLPLLQGFNSKVRMFEKVLSKGMIFGSNRPGPPLNTQNLLEHQLARARATFHCSAAKQNRFNMWASYTRKFEELQEKVEETTVASSTPDAPGVNPIKSFRLGVYQQKYSRPP